MNVCAEVFHFTCTYTGILIFISFLVVICLPPLLCLNICLLYIPYLIFSPLIYLFISYLFIFIFILFLSSYLILLSFTSYCLFLPVHTYLHTYTHHLPQIYRVPNGTARGHIQSTADLWDIHCRGTPYGEVYLGKWDHSEHRHPRRGPTHQATRTEAQVLLRALHDPCCAGPALPRGPARTCVQYLLTGVCLAISYLIVLLQGWIKLVKSCLLKLFYLVCVLCCVGVYCICV